MSDTLDVGFAQPPPSARPWVFWMWLRVDTTPEAITMDLEEMHAKGIEGVILYDSGVGGGLEIGSKMVLESLFNLKNTADQAFCDGCNLTIIHNWSHSPSVTAKPGYANFAGTLYSRNTTWWDETPAFNAYLARCSFMLQQGLFVADALYLFCRQPLGPEGTGGLHLPRRRQTARVMESGDRRNPRGRSVHAEGQPHDRATGIQSPRVGVWTVKLNGRDLGVVWTKPARVDISDAVRAAENDLEISAVNLWPNRLIGDENSPPDQRLTETNIGKFVATTPLLPSGLLGPVTLESANR